MPQITPRVILISSMNYLLVKLTAGAWKVGSGVLDSNWFMRSYAYVVVLPLKSVRDCKFPLARCWASDAAFPSRTRKSAGHGPESTIEDVNVTNLLRNFTSQMWTWRVSADAFRAKHHPSWDFSGFSSTLRVKLDSALRSSRNSRDIFSPLCFLTQLR
jgi:hypothetical protein